MSIKHRYYLELKIWNIQDSYMKEDICWISKVNAMSSDYSTELQFVQDNIDWNEEWATSLINDEEIAIFYPVYDTSTDINSTEEEGTIVVGKHAYINSTKEKIAGMPDLLEKLEHDFEKIHYLRKEYR